MKRLSRLAITLYAAAGVTFACVAQEQQRPSERTAPTLDVVSVQAMRNPQTFDLADGQRIIDRFHGIPADQRDKISLSFYAKGAGARQLDLDALRMDVLVLDRDIPVEVLGNGRVVLPPLPVGEGKDAKVVANVPKGSLSIVYKVDLSPPNEPMTMAYLQEAAAQARIAWKKLYGGVASMAVPVFSCAEFEFSSPQTISVTEGDRILWTAAEEARIRVPLTIEGATAQATIAWPRDPLVRIGGCKLKRGS